MRTFDDERILEQTISTERVYDGLILHIDRLTNRLPNGKLALREVARHIGASAVLPLDEDGNVYLVRQYRAPIDRVLLEIPAGKLDFREEDRLLAAQRELREETGLSAGKWTHLNDLLTTVGFCDEKISIYLARELHRGESHPDDDEFLNLIRMPFSEALEMVLSGEIQDAKTITALLMTDALLRKERGQ